VLNVDNLTLSSRKKKFPALTIASQNCLSLNISTRNNKTDLKILALTKHSHDIILLCDTRLNSTKQSAAIHDIEKKFKLKGYDFIHNSKGSSRGVGILLKNSLSYTVNNTIFDFEDNYILLDLNISGCRFVLGSVYGPNRDENEFFDNLKLDLRNLKQEKIIIGGDWNSTWDSSPVPQNIDVLNMVNIPSRRRALKISSIAVTLSLTDPYRFFNPMRREFTYIPNAQNNRNRSRLDFFLISESLITECKNSQIPHSLSSKLFDHKQITLCFKDERKNNLQKINDTILKDPTLEPFLLVHAMDAYLNHARVGELFNMNEKNLLTAEMGQLMGKIHEIQELKLNGALNGNFAENKQAIDRMTAELITNLDRLPPLDFFESLELECADDVFLETLAFILKNASLSFQSNFYKSKNTYKNRLRTEISALKENYAGNCDLIFEKELQLANIIELELKEELSLIKNFERLNDEKITPHFLKLAKTPTVMDSIDSICDINNEPFETSEHRHSHIHSYYSTLYKKPQAGANNFSIEEFLGECASEPEVLNSKISDEEKILLDRPLGIEELDTAVKKV